MHERVRPNSFLQFLDFGAFCPKHSLIDCDNCAESALLLEIVPCDISAGSELESSARCLSGSPASFTLRMRQIDPEIPGLGLLSLVPAMDSGCGSLP